MKKPKFKLGDEWELFLSAKADAGGTSEIYRNKNNKDQYIKIIWYEYYLE